MSNSGTHDYIPQDMELSRIFTRRTVVLLSFAIIVVFLVATPALIYSRYELQRNVSETRFRSSVRTLDNNMLLLLNNIDVTLRVISIEASTGIDRESLDLVAGRLLEQFDLFTSVLILDATGTVIVDAREDDLALGLDLSDREHFLVHRDGLVEGLYIGEPVSARTTAEWTIPVSRAIHDPDGTFKGTVITGIPPEILEAQLPEVGRISAMLASDDDRIITMIPFDEAMTGMQMGEMDSVLHTSMMRLPQMDTPMVREQGGKLLAHRHFSDYDVHLLFVQNEAQILGDFYREALLIVTGSIALAGAILLALVMQYRLGLRFFEQAQSLHLETKQRKLAENAVWKERNLLRTLIDNIPDYIFIKDKQGRFIESNKSHTQATGVEYKDILNRTAEDLFASPLASQFKQDDARVIEEGVILFNEERITVGEDGTRRWVLTTKLPLYDGSKISGLVGISRDITKRREMEDELRNSEARLRTIVSNMPAIIIEMDRSGMIEMIEGRALEKVGLDRDDLLGTLLFDLYGQCIDNLDVILRDVLAGQEENHFLPLGEYMFDAYFIPRLDNDGTVTGIISIANDITATLEAERMHFQMQQERDLIDLKERFIATASHDFRNPLAVIKMKADFLVRYDERIDASGRLQKLGDIGWQVEHMTALLENIMRLSEANMNAITLKREPVELQLFCKRVWQDMLEIDLTHTNTRYEFAATTKTITVDEHLMQYTLINILSNAFKYTPDDSEILFRIDDDEMMVYFSVEDRGIGIPEGEIENLFEPFFRASNSPKEKGKGLGLSIVKAYVDAHDGQIKVDSDLGKGTCVTISIPKN